MNIRDDALGTEWKRWERSDPSEVRTQWKAIFSDNLMTFLHG